MELTSQESRQMFPFSSRSQAKAFVRIASREGNGIGLTIKAVLKYWRITAC
jgi:hypothetical protein